ncbi:MAG TPA: hypothetical protein VFN99_00760 [Gaiella sp.]|nr:hypothetical protein [Gaiella sp.]
MRRILVPAAIAAIAGLVLASGITASPDSSAVVRFGNVDAGSPFPPPDGHDASSNGEDNVIPRTVVISAPGTVRFDIEQFGFHQPVVYAAGIQPGDIAVPAFPPNLLLSPPVGLTPGQIAKGPLHEPGMPPVSWTTSFSAPGKYLVICNLTPHFAFFNMYGWVIVT